MKNVILILLAVLIPSSFQVSAHEGLEAQIANVTKQIKETPNDATLYLKRGELYRYHQDWKLAEVDYDKAESLDAKLIFVNLERGRMFLESERPEMAEKPLNLFISQAPKSGDGYLIRARVKAKLGTVLESAKDFTSAIDLAIRPIPDVYVERAKVLAETGDEKNIEKALRGLDEGIAKFGSIVTLQGYAVELELKLKRFDAALARVNQFAANDERKEFALAQRAEIYLQAGKLCEAKQDLKNSIIQIDKLSSAERSTLGIRELVTNLKTISAKTSAAKCPK